MSGRGCVGGLSIAENIRKWICHCPLRIHNICIYRAPLLLMNRYRGET